MGKIFYLIGKSCAGKDSLYNILKKDKTLDLRPVVRYTTRPVRDGEKDGESYHFVDMDGYRSFLDAGKIIEEQVYHTVHGDWYYFTADDGSIDLNENSYLAVGVLESFAGTRDYYGRESVLPIYIEVDDGIRLQRALDREKNQENPKYQEMCRRFLADAEDFSDEKMAEAGITERFNNEDLSGCLDRIKGYLSENM